MKLTLKQKIDAFDNFLTIKAKTLTDIGNHGDAYTTSMIQIQFRKCMEME